MDISQTATPREPRAPRGRGAGPNSEQGTAAITGGAGRYDRYVDAINRLPRPVLMALTVGLFAYASFDPAGFAARMKALESVPEALWWMQGVVITYYFGAREAHYLRAAQARKAEVSNPDQGEKH